MPHAHPLLAVILALSSAPAPSTAPCRPAHLSPQAAVLVRSVLSEYFAAHAESHDDSGVYIGESPHYETFEKRFSELLASHGKPADEAIAALLCFYVGEHPAEELICEALARQKSIRPFLQRFRACPPLPGLEPIPPFFTAIPNLREEVLARIAAGKGPCQYD